MSTVTGSKTTFLDPSAPIGTLLSRLKQVDEQMAEKTTELGQINRAVVERKAIAFQESLGSSAAAAKQHIDSAVAGFTSEAAEYEADIEALKIEQVYIHSVLKYLHGHGT